VEAAIRTEGLNCFQEQGHKLSDFPVTGPIALGVELKSQS
jgi:hypothetical protein